MTDLVDIQIIELLCSRLCHELASPVGAVNNGIEMIEEFDESMLPEALPLIGSSAKLVSARLSFYRMAYGAAGTRSIASFAEVQELADAYFAEGRTTLEWPSGPVALELEDGWGKLLLNLLPLAADTLPRGGQLSVAHDENADGVRMTVVAQGESPRISEECGRAMLPDASLESLSARSVHAYFVTRLAERLHSKIDVDENAMGQIRFSVSLTR